jgi:hypothetical protein
MNLALGPPRGDGPLVRHCQGSDLFSTRPMYRRDLLRGDQHHLAQRHVGISVLV